MKKCILIFDDDPEISLVCKIILEQQNYSVETRIYCDDVIDDISKVKPDLILMDLWIPEIGGENAINLVKQNENTRNIPIILFSANVELEEVCNRIGANGFLKKPFAIKELESIVESTISQ
ncbi:MAG: response regulator [Bacteroidota bacterium]|nr:response regulator [Bacteroidota bacterium]